jgi:addiction module HigA family antidote
MPRHTEPLKLAAPHPGGFVRATIIKPLGLSVKDAAHALGVHRVALSRFLNEQADLSPEMAIRLEKAFGARLEDLMRMQNDHDIARARQAAHSVIVPRYTPVKAAVRNLDCSDPKGNNARIQQIASKAGLRGPHGRRLGSA